MSDESRVLYYVFTRTWWRNNPAYPNGLEPSAGKRRVLRKYLTRGEALRFCAEWNANNKPGRFSRKCEFDAMN